MCLARSKERPDLTPEEKNTSIRQHRSILDAIRARDISRAVESMRTNVIGMKRKLGLEETTQ